MLRHRWHRRTALEERGRCAQPSSGLALASLYEIELFNISLCRVGENLLKKKDPEWERGAGFTLVPRACVTGTAAGRQLELVTGSLGQREQSNQTLPLQ